MAGNNKCCGTCKFHRTDDNGEWVCVNDLSEYYALETDYSDMCVDWTGKDEMIVHCLFEQSGTFKNEFKKLGYEAYDYDIQNAFGQTDYVIDLFAEIETAYGGKESIFDRITKDDLILAFFPCTRFETKIIQWMRGDIYSQKNWDDEKKLEYSMKLHGEMNMMYQLISKMVIVCLRRQLRLVIENPKSIPHHLTDYWCLKPAIIDKDRRKNGDYYKKPTQYWFVNCKPKNNLVFEALDYVPQIKSERVVKDDFGLDRTIARSMIHPQYANRFIRQYLIDEVQNGTK